MPLVFPPYVEYPNLDKEMKSSDDTDCGGPQFKIDPKNPKVSPSKDDKSLFWDLGSTGFYLDIGNIYNNFLSPDSSEKSTMIPAYIFGNNDSIWDGNLYSSFTGALQSLIPQIYKQGIEAKKCFLRSRQTKDSKNIEQQVCLVKIPYHVRNPDTGYFDVSTIKIYFIYEKFLNKDNKQNWKVCSMFKQPDPVDVDNPGLKCTKQTMEILPQGSVPTNPTDKMMEDLKATDDVKCGDATRIDARKQLQFDEWLFIPLSKEKPNQKINLMWANYRYYPLPHIRLDSGDPQKDFKTGEMYPKTLEMYQPKLGTEKGFWVDIGSIYSYRLNDKTRDSRYAETEISPRIFWNDENARWIGTSQVTDQVMNSRFEPMDNPIRIQKNTIISDPMAIKTLRNFGDTLNCWMQKIYQHKTACWLRKQTSEFDQLICLIDPSPSKGLSDSKLVIKIEYDKKSGNHKVCDIFKFRGTLNTNIQTKK